MGRLVAEPSPPRRTALVPPPDGLELTEPPDVDPPDEVVEPELVEPEDEEPLDPLDGGADRTGC